MEAENSSRRDFLKTVSVAAVGVAVAGAAAQEAVAAVSKPAMISALGDTLIPSQPGDPGYKDLEPYKITEEVLKSLPGVSDADLELFNETSRGKFGGKAFLELTEAQRAEY